MTGWLARLVAVAAAVAASLAGTGPARVEPAAAASRPPIVWLVMDETNVELLLGRDGRFDARRYPELARLARTATWYRNATGIDNFTPKAVPGMLASVDGSGDRQPTLADYPVNAFSLLAPTYRIDAVQPITDLCPRSACPGPGPGFDPADPLSYLRHVAHGPTQQYAVVRAAAARMRAGEAPTLHFAHVLIPHRPWRATPDGRPYDYNGYETRDLNPATRWAGRQRAQQYAVQAGLLDTAVGVVRRRLEAQGLWRRAIVIVTADHGVNLSPGSFVREPAPDGSLDELYRVPLLIKAPGQVRGAISDVPASTLDILPTLLGLLHRPRPGSLQGIDLRGPVPRDRVRLVWAHGTSHAVAPGIADLLARVRRYDADWFRLAPSGWAHVLRVGPYGRLVGRPLPATHALPGASWRRLLPRTATISASHGIGLVAAHVRLPGGAVPADGAVLAVVGGRVVAALGGAQRDGDGYRVAGMADWRLVPDGPLALRLVIASGSTAAPRLARLAERPA